MRTPEQLDKLIQHLLTERPVNPVTITVLTNLVTQNEVGVEKLDNIFDFILDNYKAKDEILVSINYDCEAAEDSLFKLFCKFPSFRNKIKDASLLSGRTYKIEDTSYSNKHVDLPFNFFQAAYLKTSRRRGDATDIYEKFETQINIPIYQNHLNVDIPTNIHQYIFTKEAFYPSWDWFAPLTPLFDTLNSLEQEMFTSMAMTQLYIDFDGYDEVKRKSEAYTTQDVFKSLEIVPCHIISKHINNEYLTRENRKLLEQLIFNKKIEDELPLKPNIKRVKI